MVQGKIAHVKPHTKAHKQTLVLVVDGNTVSRFTTCIMLQRMEYDTFSVKTAEEALAIISIAQPRIVLTEIALPQMSGIDLLRRLKHDKGTNNIPVIIYTAQKDPALRTTCSQSGCAEFLTYPAEPDRLYEAVQTATETTPRHFVRLHTCLEIIIGLDSIPGHRVTRERVTALSVNGMYVNTSKPLPYGTILPYTICLGKSKSDEIHIEGKVLYSYSYDGRTGVVTQPGMGVKFTRISPEDKALLQAYIKEKITEGIAVAIEPPAP